jgi:hypothetical protein
MTYCIKGMTYDAILDMDREDRVWYLRRLHKQLKDEQEAMKKSGKKK